MFLFSLKPTTVEQAVAPLRTMLEDLEEISDTCTQRLARNDAERERLAIASVALDAERVRSGKVQKALLDLLGPDDG